MGQYRDAESLVQVMDQRFFNRILHLLEDRPEQGKRMIGLGAPALWELWQRIAQLDRMAQQQRAHRAGRKRQAGGGRQKDAEVLCRLLVALLYLRQHSLDARIGRNYRLCRIDRVELYSRNVALYPRGVASQFARAMATRV